MPGLKENMKNARMMSKSDLKKDIAYDKKEMMKKEGPMHKMPNGKMMKGAKHMGKMK